MEKSNERKNVYVISQVNREVVGREFWLFGLKNSKKNLNNLKVIEKFLFGIL